MTDHDAPATRRPLEPLTADEVAQIRGEWNATVAGADIQPLCDSHEVLREYYERNLSKRMQLAVEAGRLRASLARVTEELGYKSGDISRLTEQLEFCGRVAAGERTRAEQAEAALSRARETWQPIATAPKDGRVVLLYGCQFKRRIWGRGYYFKGVPGDGEGWIASSFYTEPSDDMRGNFEPTHWQDMPAAPAGRGDETPR